MAKEADHIIEYRKVRAAGKCAKCWKPSIKSKCPRCMAVSSAAIRAKRRAYRALGKCPDCGEDAQPGFVMCEACREKARKYRRKLKRRKLRNAKRQTGARAE